MTKALINPSLIPLIFLSLGHDKLIQTENPSKRILDIDKKNLMDEGCHASEKLINYFQNGVYFELSNVFLFTFRVLEVSGYFNNF